MNADITGIFGNKDVLGFLQGKNSEFVLKILALNPYPVDWKLPSLDSFILPQEDEYYHGEEWRTCPKCGEQPKVWIFDNGRFTFCCCGNSTYDRFSIRAESIMSVYARTKMTAEYDRDNLRIEWNKYCLGELDKAFHPEEDEFGNIIRW